MDDMEIFKKLAQCEDKEQMQRCIDEYNENKKTLTNADRIRAMSDEELVDKFGWHCLCDFVELKTADSCDAKGSCKNCLLEWLSQPAEGDVNNG